MGSGNEAWIEDQIRIKEAMEYLPEQLSELSDLTEQKFQQANKQLDDIPEKLNTLFNETDTKLKQLNEQIDHSIELSKGNNTLLVKSNTNKEKITNWFIGAVFGLVLSVVYSVIFEPDASPTSNSGTQATVKQPSSNGTPTNKKPTSNNGSQTTTVQSSNSVTQATVTQPSSNGIPTNKKTTSSNGTIIP